MFYIGCCVGCLLHYLTRRIVARIRLQEEISQAPKPHPSFGRYLAVAVTAGSSAFLVVDRLGYTWHSVVLLLITADLLVIAGVDQDTMVIPNGLLLLLMVPAAASIWTEPEITIIQRAAGFLVVSLPMFGMTLAIRDCFGGGDIKMMAVCGLFLGWKGAVLAIFLAILSGGSYGIYLLLTRRIGKGGHFAFGPFLTVGIWISMMYQRPFIQWYLDLGYPG